MSMRPLDPNNVLIKLLVSAVFLFVFIGLVGCSEPTEINKDAQTPNVIRTESIDELVAGDLIDMLN